MRLGGLRPPASTTIMPYVFVPPSRDKVISTDEDSLWRFYNFREGYSVVVNGSTVSSYPGINGPSGADIESAHYVYLGGHRYTISDAEYNTLVNADARWGDHCEAL